MLWFLSGIYRVDAAEEAVILRFGKYVRTETAGLHWVPRFIESYRLVNVQQVFDYSYSAEMLSKDENIVSVAVAVQYRKQNPNDFLFKVIKSRFNFFWCFGWLHDHINDLNTRLIA